MSKQASVQTAVPIDASPPARRVSVASILRGIAARWEILIPALGVFMLVSIVQFTGGELGLATWIVVWGLAAVYAVIVLISPMRLPAKDPDLFDEHAIRHAVVLVGGAVIGGTLVMAALSMMVGTSGESETSTLGTLVALLLALVLGTLGAAAERKLPVDLFPILRRREARRILYALSAALFLALAAMLWDNVASGVIARIGAAAGEAPADVQEAASTFRIDYPLVRLVQLLIGAGLIEELLFRVGILTFIWALTGRFGIGLVLSALLFGLYHISPLSGLGAVYAARPLTTVLSSFSMGIVMGLIYRYRGFETAVLVHGLGDWLIIMLLAFM